MTDEAHDALHHIDRRLIVLEERSEASLALRRWVMGLAAFAVIQLAPMLVSYGRLMQQIAHIEIGDVERNASTALAVLQDHGQELQSIRDEQARIRGSHDALQSELAQRTRDRFSSQDAGELKARVLRLENIIIGK